MSAFCSSITRERAKAVKTLCLGILLGLFLVPKLWACVTGWYYLGRPAEWEIVSAIADPNVATAVYAGTYRPWDHPEGGGVFWNAGADTTWHYAGLVGHRILRLTSFPYCRPDRIFASTQFGLYVSDDDTSWTLLNRVGYPGQQQLDFAISPHDTSLWSLATWESGAGVLAISRNSGQFWEPVHFGYGVRHLMFSRSDETLLLFTEMLSLCAINLQDLGVSTLISVTEDVTGAAYDSTQGWVYLLASHHLWRYGELNGEILEVALPDSSEYGYDVEVVPERGVAVGTPAGFYCASADLTDWRLIEDTVSTRMWSIFQVADDRLIAGGWDRVYVSDLVNHTATHDLGNACGIVSIFPNPVGSYFTVEVQSPARFQLYDILGRALLDVSFEGSLGPFLVNTHFLATGRYFYRLYSVPRSSQAPISGAMTIIH